jgi:hypothetical protein
MVAEAFSILVIAAQIAALDPLYGDVCINNHAVSPSVIVIRDRREERRYTRLGSVACMMSSIA